MTGVRQLPTGTVTFLFTDIEGSTKLLQRLGEAYGSLQDIHDRLMREAIESHRGIEIRTEGDSFFCVFKTCPEAVGTAVAAQRALAAQPWPDRSAILVRMGLHTGVGSLGGADYIGIDVHRAARIAAAAHGGQILISEASRLLTETGLPEGATLVDLGGHRLKDLAEPEHLFQICIEGLRAVFPPPRSLGSAVRLPPQLTSFIGRTDELARATALLGRHRLLTLTGPGGTGKTRLSLQVAAESALDFPNGVFFIELAPISDPDLIAPAIARALGLASTAEDPVERLHAYLNEKTLLLVLDNFEQVLAGGPQVTHLLRAAPGVKVLVSSRAPLRVSGEAEFPVPPLAVPDRSPPLADATGFEAIRLFVERGMAVRPEFSITEANLETISGIVTRLEGLPLAIELAASRLRLLSPEAILARLSDRLGLLQSGARDLPARQQTLRGAIAWSYDLLDNSAKRVFARSAVFMGGASLPELSAVVGADLDGDVLEAVEVLVDHSLMHREDAGGEPRFRMLETIREFAREQLQSSPDENEINRRHADVYLHLAEQAEPYLLRKEQTTWLDLLERDHDNLRAALAFLTVEDPEKALRLGAAIWRFWQMRGHLNEGRGRLEMLLTLPVAALDARVGALEAAGGTAYWQGDIERAQRWYQEALELSAHSSDRSIQAKALYNASFPFTLKLDRASAMDLLDRSLAIYRELGDKEGEAHVLWGMADALGSTGDPEGALRLLEQSLALFRATDNVFGLGWALFSTAFASTAAGRFREAVEHVRESLRLFDEVGDISAIVLHLGAFSQVAMLSADHHRAARLLGATEGLSKSFGIGLVTHQTNRYDPSPIIAALGDEGFAAALAEGAAMTVDQAVSYALETNTQPT
jgi:predicted ATPase/class 3 adenylate cyclase